MKEIINKYTIITFIISGIIFGSIGVRAATYLYSSNQISYNNSNSSATDVKGAIDDLYNLTNIGNATSADIYAGKTALVQGKLVTGTLENSQFTKYTKTATKYGYQDCRIDMSDIAGYNELTLNDIIISIKYVGLDPSYMQGWTSVGDFHASNYDNSTGILTIASSYYYTFQGVWPLTVDVYIIK